MAALLRRIAPQLLALAALVALVTAFHPGFLTISLNDGRLVGPAIDVLKRAAPVALLAVGMTLVIATRGIDLSVGAIMAICGAVAAWAVVNGLGFPAALALALTAGAIAGLWNGALVAVFGIQPFVATLILMTMGRGIAQLVTEGRILTFSDPNLAFMGSGLLLGLPVPVWIWMGTALGAALLMRRTALGMLVESVGINRRASALAGVNAGALILAVYMASGLCAALAGVIVAADIRGADANNAGLWLELDAILAVVIGGNSLLGGRFSIAASVIGALILQTIATGIRLAGFPSEYNLVIKAALVLTILVLQSPRAAAAWRLWRAPRGRPEAGGERDPPMNARILPLCVTLVIFLAGYALCWMQFPAMLSTRVIGNLLTDNAWLGIVAVGMTLVILSGGIDLSVGAVIAFSGVFIAVVLRETTLHPLIVFALLLVLTTGFGAAMGFLIHNLAMPAFIVTLAGMFLARGAAYMLSIEAVPIQHPFYQILQSTWWALPGRGRLTLLAVTMLVIFLLGMIVAHKTRFGASVYALGGGEATARLMGVRQGRTTVGIYAFSGAMAGLSGIVFSVYTGSGYPLATVGAELNAIAAVVIGGALLTGGAGYMFGTLVGVLTMGLIQTYIVFDGTLSSWWAKIMIGLLLLAFILLQKFLLRLSQARLEGGRT